eukprot:150869-Pleurochrysis_carterae.AAC.1
MMRGSRRSAGAHARCPRALAVRMRRRAATRGASGRRDSARARSGCVPTQGARAHAYRVSMHGGKGAKGCGRARMSRAPARRSRTRAAGSRAKP